MNNRPSDSLLRFGTALSLRRGVCAALLALVLTACGGRSGSGAVADGTADSVAQHAPSARRLTLPQPPAALSTDSARLEYVVSHYWDRFDFSDTGWIADTAALEQAFANYLSLLPMLPAERAAAAQRALLDSAAHSVPMFDRFTELQEHYLYDPNSPLRNETLYIPVLQYIIASPVIEDAYKIRPRYQLAMAQKNRPSMIAADFAYTTADNRTARLSSIRAEHTLLLFYNPGCPDCARVEEFIASSQVFAPGIESGALKLLAVYTEDDLDTWRKHVPSLPANWTVVYDKGCRIAEKELYDLRAIPCLYLLDKQKRVVLKDAPVEQIEVWLAQNPK